jgi:hypothetical protein
VGWRTGRAHIPARRQANHHRHVHHPGGAHKHGGHSNQQRAAQHTRSTQLQLSGECLTRGPAAAAASARQRPRTQSNAGRVAAGIMAATSCSCCGDMKGACVSAPPTPAPAAGLPRGAGGARARWEACGGVGRAVVRQAQHSRPTIAGWGAHKWLAHLLKHCCRRRCKGGSPAASLAQTLPPSTLSPSGHPAPCWGRGGGGVSQSLARMKPCRLSWLARGCVPQLSSTLSRLPVNQWHTKQAQVTPTKRRGWWLMQLRQTITRWLACRAAACPQCCCVGTSGRCSPAQPLGDSR